MDMPTGPMNVDYDQMGTFQGQLRTKIDEFESQCTTMNTELDTLLEQWRGSAGAEAFAGVVQEIKRQIGQLNTNLSNTEAGLGKAVTSYGEHDGQVSTAFTSMVAT
ncbi:MAG: hypothetical protein GEU79_08610 [Acidimicrobiia bacterium]|nr:hypothetical protein [Acidimicrobiia bacterium]